MYAHSILPSTKYSKYWLVVNKDQCFDTPILSHIFFFFLLFCSVKVNPCYRIERTRFWWIVESTRKFHSNIFSPVFWKVNKPVLTFKKKTLDVFILLWLFSARTCDSSLCIFIPSGAWSSETFFFHTLAAREEKKKRDRYISEGGRPERVEKDRERKEWIKKKEKKTRKTRRRGWV